jgi:hypothetical protein
LLILSDVPGLLGLVKLPIFLLMLNKDGSPEICRQAIRFLFSITALFVGRKGVRGFIDEEISDDDSFAFLGRKQRQKQRLYCGNKW